tara:strand:+ start:1332 stop:1652 length:321 start_codon:yes stop_codon:yes gene_type:complete
MEAGKLRHRITFREINSTRDTTSGDMVDTPVDLATVWASVTQMSGRELVNAQQVKPDATYKVIIRYLAGVTTDDFFTFNGRTFQILDVNNIDERNITLELMCKEEN